MFSMPLNGSLIPISHHSHSPLLPSLWQLLSYFLSTDLSILDISNNRTGQYVVFCIWLVSLHIMFSRLTYIVACVGISLFFMIE